MEATGGKVVGQGSMRQLMPGTAALVDELREAFGQAVVDRIVRDAMRGKPTMYAAEIGPDGVLREFGHSPSGRRAVLQDGELVLPWEQGE